MKRLFLLFAVWASLAYVSLAQTHFRKLSHDKGIEVAKAEGKLLFIDFYTTWCPPCKMMSEKIFPQKEVGDFMNERFVCIKLDVEKEGSPYAERYQIRAVPTFVIFNPKNKMILYNQAGATADGAAFIEKMKQAIGE